MDKRKKAVKLFNDVSNYINQSGLDVSPYTFLLNRFYLTVNNKRASSATLNGIEKKDFSFIAKKFEDRLKRDFVLSLSLSQILSLPSKKVYEAGHFKPVLKPSILLLSDSIVLPWEIEKKSQIHIAYHGENGFPSMFGNLEYYPISRETPFSISLQSTIFDIITNDSTKLRPFSFDIILDDAVEHPFPSENLVQNISQLLKHKGDYHLIVKKNFLSSPLTKMNKKLLYSLFSTTEINRFSKFLYMKLERTGDSSHNETSNIVIKDHISKKSLKLEKSCLDFNNLLTFDDGICPEHINLLSKIESKATHKSGECFRFFIGMFKESGAEPAIDKLRRSSRFKPFIRSKDIEAYSVKQVKQWIVPDKDSFFQIPPRENFEREKLILRYLSVKPVFLHDNAGLYFLNDVAAVIPRTDELDLFYSEGYFNSKVINYYYMAKFPHHSKFLKKNFNIIPFYLCSKNIQKIISDLVKEIRELKKGFLHQDEHEEPATIRTKKEQLDRFFYQLFKLTQDEINIIQSSQNN
jgi:hypothetical protein